MGQMPKVSVIIPTFKSAQYMRESIQSIVKQTYSNFEIIVVDDTPDDDGTLSILNSFHDSRIKYVKPDKRLGMVKSLNYAISISKGEFIARMDADDISHSERLERQVNYLINNKDIGVVGCNCYTINENGKVISCLIHPTDNDDIKAKMIFNVAFIHPSVMIRKDLLCKYMYNKECFCCEDYELWSRLMYVTNFHNLNEKLFKYRILNNGAMQSQLRRLQEDEEYYRRHTAILKLAYDNVLSYYGRTGVELNCNYIDLTFAKKIRHFSIAEKEEFLHSYKSILEEKCHSKYLRRCVCYQWLKMSRKTFWKVGDVKLILGSFQEIVISALNMVKTRILGVVSVNKKVYEWNL